MPMPVDRGEGQPGAGGVLVSRRSLNRAAWRALPVSAALSLAVSIAIYLMLSGGRTALPSAARAHSFARQGVLGVPERRALSAAVGRDSAAYRVRGVAGALMASNPAQRLSGSFSPTGVVVSAGGARVSLSLQAVGFGSALSPPGAVVPRAQQNRVLYEHPGLSEWYVNEPLGLEQGFTVRRPPVPGALGDHAQVLTLSIALGSDLRPVLARDARGVTLLRRGRAVLRYGEVSAVDGAGRALHSSLELRGRRILLRVDARGARFPIRIDPFIQQGGPLEGNGFGYFIGTSVAVSGDGNTALVGVGREEGGVWGVYVFTRTGSTWTQQGGKLTGEGQTGTYSEFGASLALSFNGSTALIGGPGDGEGVGGAWVFTRTGSTWAQQGAKLTGSKEGGAGKFGHSVALSEDGNTALIGGPTDGTGQHTGAAWVFTRSVAVWRQQGEKLTGDGEVGEGRFGESVALTPAGNLALVGGPEDRGANYQNGAVWVFTRSGETWAQQGAKIAGPQGSDFGRSVAVSSTGTTALIGAPGDTFGALYEGVAYVLTRSGETWTQQGGALTKEACSCIAHFGDSVAVSGDGNTALVGAEGQSLPGGGVQRGRGVAIFTRSGETWTKRGEEIEEVEREGSYYGYLGTTLSLSTDGKTALISGDYGQTNPGRAAYVYVNTPVAPKIAMEGTSMIAKTSLTVSGKVNPEGEEVTACEVEYGLTTSYGTSAPCASLPGAGERYVAVTASPTGLQEQTTYHYRIAATNGTGTGYGADETFSTRPFQVTEYGQCEGTNIGAPKGKKVKNTHWKDSNCSIKEPASDPDGKFEWFPGAPKGCIGFSHGQYSTSTCTGPPHRGSWERRRCFGAGTGCADYSWATGTVTLETPGLSSKVTCTASAGSGELLGRQAGVLRLTLTGCEAAGQKCRGLEGSSAEGEVLTSVLETYATTAAKLNEEPEEVLTRYANKTGAHAPYLLEFRCGSADYFRTKGSLSGAMSGDVNIVSSTSHVAFAAGVGAQGLETEGSTTANFEFPTGPFPTTATASATDTAVQPTELKSQR